MQTSFLFEKHNKLLSSDHFCCSILFNKIREDDNETVHILRAAHEVIEEKVEKTFTV